MSGDGIRALSLAVLQGAREEAAQVHACMHACTVTHSHTLSHSHTQSPHALFEVEEDFEEEMVCESDDDEPPSSFWRGAMMKLREDLILRFNYLSFRFLKLVSSWEV